MRPYHPRVIRYHDVHEHAGWRLKRFTISFDGTAVNWTDLAPGFALAEAALPSPARTAERPGVGFLIAHHGRTGEYLILGWWDRENELPLRLYVCPPDEDAWRPASERESVCVWDLEVIWAERQAYVDTVLAPGASIDAYLARHGGWAEDEVPM